MRNKAGQTALHLHTFAGNIGCVVTLLSYGADIDAQDLNGNTCLHLAVSRTNIDIAKALLVFGANVNILNKSGHSARHLAAKLDGRGKYVLYLIILCQQFLFLLKKSY
ncbi:unnamed protein product [Soboliphyme baturini]|uniref:ANK_REP_REGION domain-containing protein n=1 Tax=Soboliphyme baturini TaxID=241478 RepID=A0A183J3Z9_9BILA|nr:unnamed protein product [Soboliphyme baturini]